MTLKDFLARLQGVKGSGNQYVACCPAHGDNRQSLSVSVGAGGRVIVKCHAGCTVNEITAALGLTVKDLFVEDRRVPSPVVATYNYTDESGRVRAQKLRRADKSFTWRQPDGNGGFVYNRKGVPFMLYVPGGSLGSTVYIVEGEKDADTLHRLGFCAACGMDGAGPGKWKKEYTGHLRGRTVCVFPDNDAPGFDFAAETCRALQGVAAGVHLADLREVWPEIPEHGDVSDLVARFGDEDGKALIWKAIAVAAQKEWSQAAAPAPPPDPLLRLFKPLSEIPEEEASWIIPGWVPKGQITVIAADGGVGKTSLFCHIISALSSGRACILDPPEISRSPQKFLFMSAEDSFRKKLKKQLRLAGANMENIIVPDFADDKDQLAQKILLGSKDLDTVLRAIRPVMCIFDPVQGFTPPKVNMGSRNEMRACTAPLITIGEDIGTASILVVHTNKRGGAYGRSRIADSADMWDVARSVIMCGFTEEEGVRYISNEKNNYAALQETVLFTIDENGQINDAGRSWKRDKDYILLAMKETTSAKREDCKAFILKTLNDAGGSMISKDLDKKAKAAGYSFNGVRKAKEDLSKDGKIKSNQRWDDELGKNVWRVTMLIPLDSDPEDFQDLQPDVEDPFEQTTLADEK